MDADHSTNPANGSRPSATRRPQTVDGCYVAPPCLADVLFEQLDYLVSHARQGCEPGCPICERLSRVLEPLLEPFRT
jgi:hypothetical protein